MSFKTVRERIMHTLRMKMVTGNILQCILSIPSNVYVFVLCFQVLSVVAEVSIAVYTATQTNTSVHLTIAHMAKRKLGKTIQWWLEKKFRSCSAQSRVVFIIDILFMYLMVYMLMVVCVGGYLPVPQTLIICYTCMCVLFFFNDGPAFFRDCIVG